jgi:hypothetical protein
MMMSKYKMEVYMVPSGVLASYDWKTEEDFQRAQAFLLDLLGPGGRSGASRGDLEYYYVETEQQREDFYKFVKTPNQRA